MKRLRIVMIISCLSVMVLLLHLMPIYAKISNKNIASFTYVLGTYSSYNVAAYLVDDSEHRNTGTVEIFDNGTHIFMRVVVWCKPYLAWGELDKNYDGILDDPTKDRDDLASDGWKIQGLGGPPGYTDYQWYVGVGKRRDSAISVPSWDNNVGPATPNILTGPIEYYATIPIPSGTSFSIYMEVHASPPDQNFQPCKITSFKRSPCKFSPNGDGRKDTTTIDATFSISVSWKLQIKPFCGCDYVVREWNGIGASFTIVWDGKDDAGIVVPDGAYRLILKACYTPCMNMRIVVVDTTPPTVTDVTVSPDPFNPLTETARINYTLSECARVTIKIFTTSPWTLRRTLIKNEKQLWGFHSIPWDGKDDLGNNLPAGTYHIRIYVTDLVGNKATIYPVKITVNIV